MYDPDELIAAFGPYYPLTREQAETLCEEMNRILQREVGRATEGLDQMIEEALRRHRDSCPAMCHEPEMGSEEWLRLRRN